jgi:exodeoxyribonuclease V gamma subunit
VLTWRVLGILREEAFVAVHPPLAGYLRHADDVMRYELAARTAALLEQYLTYRPDWLAAWLAGKPAGIESLGAAHAADAGWQGALWRRIAGALDTDSRHPSVAFFDAMKQMGPEAPARAGLPETAHLFCLPTTPPLYLDILQRLAQWIDLRLYVLNPCREYWLEVVDPRRLSWLAAERRADHHEVGNRLLAAWGRQTQAHIDLLLRGDDAAVVDDAGFAPSEGASLLARLQNAILDMTDLPRGSVALAEEDRSIEVHVCHSLTREIEVLQDQLLTLFAGENPPRPSDILVVTPDLEAAAPLIEAVFGNVPKSREIPFAITGRPVSVQNPCAQALLGVLAVATSRFRASAVFELLQQPIVARRFGIGNAERMALHAWIGDAGIRWGIDGRQRGRLGLPAVARHSFGDGFDRLFLGYAFPASASAPLNGRLPAGDPEGSEALALGSFREFVRRLERLHDALAQPKTPAEWRQTLLGVIDDFTAPTVDEMDAARETAAGIHELHGNMANAGMRGALHVDVVRTALEALLDDPARGGVPGGAVTFAAMASLRNLPYRFVCALGLNDGVFPSTQRPVEFDLMARAPRPGDRQRRIDERNVFLDLVLAARERLYLSYTGRSVRDNSPIPPSVLVAELLDYAAAAIDRTLSPASLAAARQRLTVLHPLQAFSLDYYRPEAEPRRRSFNDEYCEALRQRLAAPSAPRVSGSVATVETEEACAAADEADDEDAAWEPQERFFQAPLARAGPEFREVTLDGLAHFFRNPCRYLLERRLGIVLPQSDEELQDDEPFVPDWPARDALARRVLPRLLDGRSLAELRAFAHAGVEYPEGRLGEFELEQELQRLDHFAHALAPALAEPQLDPVNATLDFAVDGEPWRLTGGFGDLRRSGLVRYRYDDARAGDYLNGWLGHLFVNAIAPPGIAARTTWHSRDGRYVLPAIGDARAELEALLRLYRDGLHRPLHFFPRSAWCYMVEDRNLSKAAEAWQSTLFRRFGEDRDAAYRVALRGVDAPLDAEFVACATTVFGRLLDVIEDDRVR